MPQQDGAWAALRVTGAGLRAIGAGAARGDATVPAQAAEWVTTTAEWGEPVGVAPTGRGATVEGTDAIVASVAPAPTARSTSRDAARRVIDAWDDDVSARGSP